MKVRQLIMAVAGLVALGQAHVSAQSYLNYTGGVYTQNFDSLPYSNNVPVKAADPVTINGQTYYFNSTAPVDFAATIDFTGPTNNSTGGFGLSATMPGWYFVCGIANQYGAQKNGITTGGIYNFGNATSANRALGFVTAGSSGLTTYGLKIVNNTGGDINQINLSFTGELWLQQTVIKTNDFGYLVSNTTSLPTNAVTPIGYWFMSGGASNGVDGTLSANQTNVNVAVSLNTPWANGGTLWLTWQADSTAGKAQQTAIDNLTFVGCTPPSAFSISLTPSTVVCSGTSVLFSNNASGGVAPYTYQWLKNNSNISGATNFTYTGVAGTDFSDQDQIKVTAYSACGAPQTAPPVTMTVNVIPSAPTATAATSVGTTLLSANWNAATGATGYRLDVATDSGFTSFLTGYNNLDVGNVTTYSVTGLTAATPYYYRVRAYSTCGTSGNSGPITVTTDSGCVAATAATPVASPSATVCAGTTLTLTETPSAGAAPFNYLWKKGGAAISNGGTISGVTSNVLQIAGVATGDAGNYTCDVSAQCGGATNTSPQLTVAVNALPTITLGASPTVCAGTTSASLPYSATTGSPDQYSITWDSTAHTAGFADVSYTSLPGSSITLSVPVAAANVYNGTLAVKNSSTNCASSSYSFTVTIHAHPTITAQPIRTMVAQGSAASFTVATSASSPSYQWQVNKGSGFVNVTGGDGSGGATFTTVATTTGMNTFQYQCIVTDGSTGCQTTSSAATLAVPSPFTAGDLAVFSADSAAANNTAFSIIELNTNTANQTAVQTISINGTGGSTALRTSGSASSTGYLSDSDDGSYLAFAAHNSTNTAGNANAITNRAVATFDSTGKFTLQTTYAGTSGNQARSATTVNNFTWYIGDQSGIYTNATSTALTNANIRSVKSFGGTVYVLQQSASAGTIVVSTLSADGRTITGLNGLANDSSAVDFCLVASGSNGSTSDVLYVLENASATLGAMLKYSLVNGSWTDSGVYLTSFGGFGLCAAKSGGGAALYATTGTGATAANSVIKLTDTAGYNSGISIAGNATLYTAAAGTTIKGIAFAPITPPATGPEFQVLTITTAGDDIRLMWTTAGGTTNAVQAGPALNAFTDISDPIIIAGTSTDSVTNNYVDSMGATNAPARYYRIRLMP